MKGRIRAFATFRAVFSAALRQGERRLLLHVTEFMYGHCMEIPCGTIHTAQSAI